MVTEVRETRHSIDSRYVPSGQGSDLLFSGEYPVQYVSPKLIGEPKYPHPNPQAHFLSPGSTEHTLGTLALRPSVRGPVL